MSPPPASPAARRPRLSWLRPPVSRRSVQFARRSLQALRPQSPERFHAATVSREGTSMTLLAEHWRPALEAPGDQVDAFRDAVSATHLPWSLAPPEPAPFRPDDGLDRYRFGDLTLVDCRCGPCGGHRGRAQLAATHE